MLHACVVRQRFLLCVANGVDNPVPSARAFDERMVRVYHFDERWGELYDRVGFTASENRVVNRV
jgi:hypothetical protein